MNKTPKLVSTHKIERTLALCVETSGMLVKRYNGLLDNSCLLLLAEEWDARSEEPSMTIKVFTGFEDTFNIHKFAQGFTLEAKAQFRQATIAELLALGVQDKKIGLKDFVYCLGSAHIDPKGKIACGMVSPTVFYPGLESMDGCRQMLVRAICNPWDKDTQVALVQF